MKESFYLTNQEFGNQNFLYDFQIFQLHMRDEGHNRHNRTNFLRHPVFSYPYLPNSVFVKKWGRGCPSGSSPTTPMT